MSILDGRRTEAVFGRSRITQTSTYCRLESNRIVRSDRQNSLFYIAFIKPCLLSLNKKNQNSGESLYLIEEFSIVQGPDSGPTN